MAMMTLIIDEKNDAIISTSTTLGALVSIPCGTSIYGDQESPGMFVRPYFMIALLDFTRQLHLYLITHSTMYRGYCTRDWSAAQHDRYPEPQLRAAVDDDIT